MFDVALFLRPRTNAVENSFAMAQKQRTSWYSTPFLAFFLPRGVAFAI